jgi:acyl-coenzyme A thioesterase 13
LSAFFHSLWLEILISVDGKLQDELELTSRVLGQRGGYSGTVVLIRNKVTGEVIAEGRHSLFGKHASKL